MVGREKRYCGREVWRSRQACISSWMVRCSRRGRVASVNGKAMEGGVNVPSQASNSVWTARFK